GARTLDRRACAGPQSLEPAPDRQGARSVVRPTAPLHQETWLDGVRGRLTPHLLCRTSPPIRPAIPHRKTEGLAPQGGGATPGWTGRKSPLADIARLIQLIEPEARALGLELVRVKMMQSEAGDGGEALQVMAEDPATGQLIIDQCAALSRRVSDAI